MRRHIALGFEGPDENTIPNPAKETQETIQNTSR
jgi:hypothetical protein